MRLEGKVAIITGAGSGIGRATAERFADEGARLVVSSQSERGLQEVVERSDEAVKAVAGDISDEAVARELAETARKAFGRIDILVNNAGMFFCEDVTDTSVEDWDRVMAVNLRSMFLTCKHVIPTMLEQAGGSIVNVASISAYIGQEMDGRSSVAYNVSKAATRQLATSLASRYAGEGIRVNAVAPGSTRTEIVRNWRPDLTPSEVESFFAGAAEATPLGRIAEPDELAAAILFLASDEASFVTGATLTGDGGFLAL